MSQRHRFVLAAMLAALINCAQLWALNAAPALINYQARLTNSGGTALNGTYSLVFTIYDAPVGGNVIWQEGHNSVAVADGFLSVILGAGSTPVPLGDAVFASDTRYLGVKIGSDPEISPRSRMVSVGYSQRVNTVDKARGGVISGNLELQDDPSREGDLVSAKILVRGASLRVVRIEPSADVALSATSTDGDEVLNLSASETGGSVTVKGSSNNAVASIAAVPTGGEVTVNAANGEVAAQLNVSTDGGQITLSESSKDASLSSPRTKILPRKWLLFGDTQAESVVVVRPLPTGAGVIEVADYSTPTPSTVSIGDGAALKMKNSAGQTVVDVSEASTRLSGNFTVAWPADKAPGDGLVSYGLNNTFNFNLGGGNPSHAENSFVVGESNATGAKNTFVVGTSNLIIDDADPVLHGDNSAIIGLNNTVYGDNSFTFGELNYIGANRSAAFGRFNHVDGGGNCFAFGDSNYVTSTGNSSILGGNFNLLTWSPNSVIAGGFSQTMNLSGYSFMGAGYDNNITGTDEPTHRYNTIGGGFSNDISSAGYASIAGGRQNVASGEASTIAGGRFNTASGAGSSIIGGTLGVATGVNSAVLGGYQSIAGGQTSLAAGFAAKARHQGAFVLSAYNSGLPGDSIRSGGDNQMVLRAPGGIYITNSTTYAATPYDVTKLISTPVAGCYLTNAGVWTSASDRNLKENFAAVDEETILKKLSELPITEWNYKVDADDQRHIGPMAQDFYRLFNVGYDDKSLTTIDPSGVAFAAIQALYKRTEQLQKQSDEIETLKAQLADMQAKLAKLASEKN